jgi:hypothetical protein
MLLRGGGEGILPGLDLTVRCKSAFQVVLLMVPTTTRCGSTCAATERRATRELACRAVGVWTDEIVF